MGGPRDGFKGKAWENWLQNVLALVQHALQVLCISFQKLLCKVSIYQLLCISNVCVYTKAHRDRKANVPVLSRGEKSNFVVWGRKADGILRAAGLQRMKLEPTLERSAVALGNN